jgi:hypothetical protein
MTSIEIVLVVLVVFLISLYVLIKFKSGKGFTEILKDAKRDIHQVKESVLEAKSLLTDDLVQKTLRSFMIEVESENNKHKATSHVTLSGTQKKIKVIETFKSWLTQVLGTIQKAEDLINNNRDYIENLIDDFVEFTHKMSGK